MSDNADYGAYRIVPCSCVCGGNIAWVRIRPSGAEEMIGCVCHQTPMELIGRTLSPNDGKETPMTDEVKLLRQMMRRAEPLVRAYGESREAALMDDSRLCDEWLAIFETWEMSQGDAS